MVTIFFARSYLSFDTPVGTHFVRASD